MSIESLAFRTISLKELVMSKYNRSVKLHPLALSDVLVVKPALCKSVLMVIDSGYPNFMALTTLKWLIRVGQLPQ